MMIDEVRRLSDYLRQMQPYKLRTHFELKKADRLSKKYAAGIGLSFVALAMAASLAQPVLAALKSNTVSLVNNRLTVAASTGGHCSGNNKTDVNVTSNNNQTASSGNAGVNSNTTGGSASSGNTSNSNSTNVVITINC